MALGPESPGMRFAARSDSVVGTGSSRDEDPRQQGRGSRDWAMVSRGGDAGKGEVSAGMRPRGAGSEFLESGSGATNSGRLGPCRVEVSGKGGGGGRLKERVTTGPAGSMPPGGRGTLSRAESEVETQG